MPLPGGTPGRSTPPSETVISDPIHFAHGVVDIVQQNLTDPGPATRQLSAPI